MLWASCRYIQFVEEIQRLLRSVNIGPDRQATKKVLELGRDFGYPSIVRRPERVPWVGIGIGKLEHYFFLIV